MKARACPSLLLATCLLATTAGCQSLFPELTESPTDGISTERLANVPKPGGLRRNTSPGQASGLSEQAREIEQKFGFE